MDYPPVKVLGLEISGKEIEYLLNLNDRNPTPIERAIAENRQGYNKVFANRIIFLLYLRLRNLFQPRGFGDIGRAVYELCYVLRQVPNPPSENTCRYWVAQFNQRLKATETNEQELRDGSLWLQDVEALNFEHRTQPMNIQGFSNSHVYPIAHSISPLGSTHWSAILPSPQLPTSQQAYEAALTQKYLPHISPNDPPSFPRVEIEAPLPQMSPSTSGIGILMSGNNGATAFQAPENSYLSENVQHAANYTQQSSQKLNTHINMEPVPSIAMNLQQEGVLGSPTPYTNVSTTRNQFGIYASSQPTAESGYRNGNNGALNDIQELDRFMQILSDALTTYHGQQGEVGLSPRTSDGEVAWSIMNFYESNNQIADSIDGHDPLLWYLFQHFTTISPQSPSPLSDNGVGSFFPKDSKGIAAWWRLYRLEQ